MWVGWLVVLVLTCSAIYPIHQTRQRNSQRLSNLYHHQEDCRSVGGEGEGGGEGGEGEGWRENGRDGREGRERKRQGRERKREGEDRKERKNSMKCAIQYGKGIKHLQQYVHIHVHVRVRVHVLIIILF